MYKASVLEVRDTQGNVAFKYVVSDTKTRKVVFRGPNRATEKAAMKDSICFLYSKKPDASSRAISERTTKE